MPWLVGGKVRTAGGMSCQVSTAIRAPRSFSGSHRRTLRPEEVAVLFVGVDWAERHHDVCLLDDRGAVLAKRRIPDGLVGVTELHALVAGHAEDPRQVVVGIETDRGLLVGALLAAGYQAQPPPGRRRLAARCGGQGPGPRPPAAGVDPAGPGECAAQRAAGVLPGRAGRVRHRPGQPRRAGRAGLGAHADGRPRAVPGGAGRRAAAGWPPGAGAGTGDRDPGGAAQPAAGRAGAGRRRLRPGDHRHRGAAARAQRPARGVGGGTRAGWPATRRPACC